MIMKNTVSYELSEKFSLATKMIETLKSTVGVLEQENNSMKDILNSLVSINNGDYNHSHGELGDTKYAHSA
jgi:hypothetical protein